MNEAAVNVLHIIPPGAENFGGIDAFLLNYYSYINHEKVHFDFAYCVCNNMRLYMHGQVFKGSTFTEFRALEEENNRLSNWTQLIRSIRHLLKAKCYDIVEIHSVSPMIQLASMIALKGLNVKTKIAHAHAMQEPTDSLLNILISSLCKFFLRKCYDLFFSCTIAAGEIYGRQVLASNRFYKINNAIEVDKFFYSEEIRRKIRLDYGVTDNSLIVGHVARLSEEKNQVFLVELFYEILKENHNSLLWIIGEGSSRKDIEKRVHELGIEKNVRLFGQRTDVQVFLQAMDVFVMPSRFEGLCISAIESQVAGLLTYVSTGVPEECRITDGFKRISLERGAEEWAKEILKDAHGKRDRKIEYNLVKDYDVEYAARKLEEIYCSCRNT